MIGALTLRSGSPTPPPSPPEPPLQCAEPEVVSEPPSPRPTIEVAFVLDTTGSMGGLLEGAKAKIWSIASRIAQGQPSPRLRVGLVGYRDVDDAYVTRTFPLREDLDAVYADLTSFRAQGGGDTPEHVAAALRDAVEDLQWSSGPDVLKVIYVVGDAPPQAYPREPTAEHWSQVARRRGIIVNTVRCGSSDATQVSFQQLAQHGGGLYFSVEQSGGMAAVRTPYDDEIRRLELEAGSLAMVGGRAAARRESAKKGSEVAAMPAEVGADRTAFLAASGAGGRRWVSEGAVDLAAEPEALADLAEEELPPELSTLTPKARQVEVARRAQRRAEIDARLQALVKRRQAHLKAEAQTRGGGVDDHVLSDIQTRAAKVGVTYR